MKDATGSGSELSAPTPGTPSVTCELGRSRLVAHPHPQGQASMIASAQSTGAIGMEPAHGQTAGASSVNMCLRRVPSEADPFEAVFSRIVVAEKRSPAWRWA